MAIAGAVVAVRRPDGAYPGDQIPIVPVIQNTGTVRTWFAMSLNWQVAGAWQSIAGANQEVSPGREAAQSFTVVMPNVSTGFYVRILAVNPDTNLWEQVAWTGPYTVARLSENAYSAIIGVEFPARIRAGASGYVTVVVRNTGRVVSWLNAWFNLMVGGTITVQTPAAVWVEPNELGVWTFNFTMPPTSCQFFVRTLYVNPATNLWEQGDTTPWTVLVLDTDEYKAVSKPPTLHSILTSDWLNVKRGAWFDQWPIVIPWWTFEPGKAIEGAIDWVIDGINWLVGKSKTTWQTATDAFSKAWEAFGRIDDWLRGALSWFYTQVNNWWSTTWVNVQSWVRSFIDSLQYQVNLAFSDITGLNVKITNLATDYDTFKVDFINQIKNTEPFPSMIDAYNTVQAIIEALPEELGAFFSDPAGWIFDKIDDWLNEPVE
jgi:hypothetical protein